MITSSEVSVNHLNVGQLPSIYRLEVAQAQTLYRGDVLNAALNGMPSKIDTHVRSVEVAKSCVPFIRWDANERGAESRFARVIDALGSFDIPSTKAEMKSLIELGDEVVIDLFIKWHTDGLPFSPFTSTTFSPKIAQMHASKWGQSTIYEVRLSPERAILDAKNEGGSGAGGEILVFGGIEPSEIGRVKFSNVPENSELLDGHWLKDPRDFDLSDFRIRDSSDWQLVGV